MLDMAKEITFVLQDHAFLLLALMVIDIATGVIKGTKGKSLKSTVMSLGIRKKSAMVIGIVFSVLLDLLMFDGSPTFSTMMLYLVMANEGLSIVENLTQLGVPIPKVITKRLEVMKDQNTGIDGETSSPAKTKPVISDQEIEMDKAEQTEVTEQSVPNTHQGSDNK